METDLTKELPYKHILMPKVVFHQTIEGTDETKSVGLTIDVETRDTLTWNTEEFNRFVEEHLIEYCFPPSQCQSISPRDSVKMSLDAFEFLRKYCERWKQEKNSAHIEKNYTPLKGVLGEWFLHAFTTTFFETQSLYSKVYLHQGKAAVHGFDLVHYKEEKDGLGFSLWLGEAKFYSTISNAISAALDSLNKACSYNYLKSQDREAGFKGEIAFINRYSKTINSEDNVTIQNIHQFLDRVGVDDFLTSITIPVLLTVSLQEVQDLKNKTREEIHSAIQGFSQNASQEFFAKITSDFNHLEKIKIRLFLLPLGNYEELVASFESRISRIAGNGNISAA